MPNRAILPSLFIVLLLLALLPRCELWSNYEAIESADTSGYERLALGLTTADFSLNEGLRTPGYPLLMLICGMNHNTIWIVQSLFGVLLTLLLSAYVYKFTRHLAAAVIVGLLSANGIQLWFYEPMMLTEVLATLLFSLLIIALSHGLYRQSTMLHSIGVAILVAALIMTKPVFILFSILIPIAYIFSHRSRTSYIHAATVLTVSLFPAVIWMTVNYMSIGQFTLSTTKGMNLASHSIPMMQIDATGQHAVIENALAEAWSQNQHIRERTQDNRPVITSIAIRQLLSDNNYDWPELSRDMTDLSFATLIKHPVQYAHSIAIAWLRFWRPNLMLQTHVLTSEPLRRWIKLTWLPTKAMYMLASLVCLLYYPWSFNSNVRRDTVLFALITLILAVSALQAFVEYGENARYGIPLTSTTPALAALALVSLSERTRQWRLQLARRRAS